LKSFFRAASPSKPTTLKWTIAEPKTTVFALAIDLRHTAKNAWFAAVRSRESLVATGSSWKRNGARSESLGFAFCATIDVSATGTR
jgi:hypothetical protein